MSLEPVPISGGQDPAVPTAPSAAPPSDPAAPAAPAVSPPTGPVPAATAVPSASTQTGGALVPADLAGAAVVMADGSTPAPAGTVVDYAQGLGYVDLRVDDGAGSDWFEEIELAGADPGTAEFRITTTGGHVYLAGPAAPAPGDGWRLYNWRVDVQWLPAAPAQASMPAGFGATVDYFAGWSLEFTRPNGTVAEQTVNASEAMLEDGRVVISLGDGFWDSSKPFIFVAPDGARYQATLAEEQVGYMPDLFIFVEFSLLGAPRPAPIAAPASPGESPQVMPLSAALADPAVPDAMVLPGEQPPGASGPAPYSEAVQIAHTTAVPSGQHTFVDVGARAAAVNIPLPSGATLGQNVYISDSSGQAHQYPITITPAAGQGMDEYDSLVIRNSYAVVHLRYDGAGNWKIL